MAWGPRHLSLLTRAPGDIALNPKASKQDRQQLRHIKKKTKKKNKKQKEKKTNHHSSFLKSSTKTESGYEVPRARLLRGLLGATHSVAHAVSDRVTPGPQHWASPSAGAPPGAARR